MTEGVKTAEEEAEACLEAWFGRPVPRLDSVTKLRKEFTESLRRYAANKLDSFRSKAEPDPVSGAYSVPLCYIVKEASELRKGYG